MHWTYLVMFLWAASPVDVDCTKVLVSAKNGTEAYRLANTELHESAADPLLTMILKKGELRTDRSMVLLSADVQGIDMCAPVADEAAEVFDGSAD